MRCKILNNETLFGDSFSLSGIVVEKIIATKTHRHKEITKNYLRKILRTILILLLPLSLSAQNIEDVLSEIEINNTTLRAYRNLNEAQKLENKTGIYLENPEAEYHYLWGDPSSMGTRHDFAISQSFDFPTAYGIKKEIADAKNIQSDLEYELHRKTILYKAKTICNQLIYLSSKGKVLAQRVSDASDIAKAYTTKFEQGEINVLEKNKAEFHLLNAKKEFDAIFIEWDVLVAELFALNGDKVINFKPGNFSPVILPEDFTTWYEDYESKNIVLQQATNKIGISEKQIKLSKAMSLPKFSGGYMSETVEGEGFRGIAVGMSIPLWENKNKVKLASAQQQLALELANDQKIKVYNQLKAQYHKAVSLQKMLASYRETLQTVNSTELLKKALDAGEISLIEYMMELTLYYETTDKFLSIEKELNQLATGLYFFEL